MASRVPTFSLLSGVYGLSVVCCPRTPVGWRTMIYKLKALERNETSGYFNMFKDTDDRVMELCLRNYELSR